MFLFFFVLSRAWDKEKILSPHEESNLRPSDSALQCSTTFLFKQIIYIYIYPKTIEKSLNENSLVELFSGIRASIFSLSHGRDGRAQYIPYLLFLSTNITLSTFLILAVCRTRVVEHRSAESEGLRFDPS